MTAEIIQFGKPNAARHSAPACNTQADISKPTTTARNANLRNERWKAWDDADFATKYWSALIKFHHAVSMAARSGLREACLHSRDFNDEAEWRDRENYREAVRRQMFTPAPNMEAVNWKRSRLNDEPWTGVKKERLEQVIADDVAFLKAHPTRVSHAMTNGS